MVLSLQLTKFKNNTLVKGWISNISFRLAHLLISGSSLTSISPGVFDDAAFSKLSKLELSGITLSLLQSGTFTGLIQVEFLTIINSRIEEIDRDVFQPFRNKITNLHIENSYIALPQFTGNSDLKNVKIAQFYQVSPMDVITSEYFSGLEQVVSLYLYGNHINEIQEFAFRRQTSLQLLHINLNSISTLSRNIFDLDMELPTMFVADNPWNCTCDLKWLQDAIRVKQNKTKESPKCRLPAEYDSLNIVDVDICMNGETMTPTTEPQNTAPITTDTTPEPDSSSTIIPEDDTTYSTTVSPSSDIPSPPSSSTFTTPETNTSSTTQASVGDVQVKCTESAVIERSLLFSRKHRRRLLWSRSNTNNLVLTQQSLNFSIEDYESGIVTVTINSLLTPSDILIWFIGSSDYVGVQETSSSSIGCFTGLKRETSVVNLNAGETYTFCLLKGGEKKVSPLDCRSHAVSVPWHLKAWMSNEHKAITIGITSTALVMCLFVGAFLVYCIIRKNPSLLRGSKRVVMVKHRAADAIVMPPNFKDVCENKKDFKRPPKSSSLANKRSTFRRSISETSIISTRSAAASYVSAVEPTAVQLLHWRLERLRGSPPGGEQWSPAAYLMPPAPRTSSPPVPPKRPPITDFILESDSLSGISEIDT